MTEIDRVEVQPVKCNIHIKSQTLGVIQRSEYGKMGDHLTADEKIEISVSYPLSHTVNRQVRSKGGFTVGAFVCALSKMYHDIYRAPKKHGIWGHGLRDLYLERIVEKEPGRFAVEIGS